MLKQIKKKAGFGMMAAVFGIILSVEPGNAQDYNNPDLLVGLTSTSGGTDLIYDIGSASSLYNGESWSLPGGYTGSLNNQYWGVIGEDGNDSGNGNAWTTDDPNGSSTYPPPAIQNSIDFLDSSMNSICTISITSGQYFTVSASGNEDCWNYQTINGVHTGNWVLAWLNPNVASSGPGTLPFFRAVDDGSNPVRIGTFTLNSSGQLTYNVFVTTPPTPKIVNVTRAGTTTTVYFTTTNSYTYTLYYTNSAGLTSSVTSWLKSATTVTGSGSLHTNSIADTTADATRFYRVGAQ